MSWVVMPREKRQKPLGFTLIELLITLGLVVTVMAYGVPYYQSQVAKGYREAAKAALSEVVAQVELRRAETANGQLQLLINPLDLLGERKALERYEFFILPNPVGVNRQFWAVAYPLPGAAQQGDGGLMLSSNGEGCWYKQWDRPAVMPCTGQGNPW